MRIRWFDIFRSPKFDDIQATRRARNLHHILLIILVAEIATALFASPGMMPSIVQAWSPKIMPLALLAITTLLIFDNKAGNTNRAAHIQFGLLWVALFSQTALLGGISHPIFIFIGTLIIMVALALSLRETIIYIMASIAVTLLLNQAQHLLPQIPTLPENARLVPYSINFILIGLLLAMLLNDISQALAQAKRSEAQRQASDEAIMNNQLIIESQAIELAQQQSLLDIFELLRSLAQEQINEDQLLSRITTAIADALGLEHVAIFILDETQQFAFLRAASSEAGQTLMQLEGYRLSVHLSTALSGSVSVGLPELGVRIKDTNYKISRPIPMPDMNSESTHPLISGEKLIGLLNLQSREADEIFGQTNLMNLLVAQVAQTIQSNRYKNQINAQLLQLETLTGERISDAWKRVSAGNQLSYRFDRIRTLKDIEDIPPDALQQIRSGNSTTYRTAKQTLALAAPIQLSGQVIGIIGYELKGDRASASPEEITLLNAIAIQISVALENARLFAESQQLAQNERMIASVTNQIRESLDVEAVLRSATQQIQRALNVQMAEIRLGTTQEFEQDNVARKEVF